MHQRIFWVVAVFGVIGVTGSAQPFERRASITGGGGPGEGKCTIEVVVDGAAEVEIRGDRALLRNVSGRLPEWRRFQCNVPLPENPREFRFHGVDGRGLQQLVRDPARGGAAVVRIEDSAGGAEGYTFDLMWRADGFGRDGGRGPDFDRPGERRRFTVDEAVRVCQDTVRERAMDRLRGQQIEFRRTSIDDNPGRQDWVIGTFEARRWNGRVDVYRFSCSVNFDNGRVRSADFQRGDRR